MELAIRILIVDDYEPWRSCVLSLLKENPDFEVVGEGSDGMEAIQMSAELQPDLVLLDIGLPKLNGFDAARRIRKVSADSKIVFLSQNRSQALVREARKIGAHGFVAKIDAAYELMPALKAALDGK